MENNLTIRKAELSDLAQVVELWKELMDFHSELDPLFMCSEDGPGNFLKWIELRVSNANDVAQGFWEKMGFKPYMTTIYKEE